jgi:AcrR family transcriptional regulator
MRTEQPRWSRRDPDDRRREILAAARRLFATRPYAEVSVTAVAREAGVSRALVTHYFGGKRELFVAVLGEVVQAARQVPATDEDLPIEQLVARNVSAWMDFMESNHELLYTFAAGTALVRDRDVAAVVDQLRDGVVERMLRNHFPAGDPPAAAHAVLRAATGLVQVAVADWLWGRRTTREQAQVLITESLLTLVREVLPAVARV